MRMIFAAMLFYSLLTCFSCASAKKAPQPLPMDIRPEDYKITFKINPNVKPVEYKRESFVRYENVLAYENDERFRYRLGIDISRHEGKINWKKVRQSGREFVFLRIGWTGYQTGIIHTDERFHYNIKKATKAGMEIGVYYFSQALNEEEASLRLST